MIALIIAAAFVAVTICTILLLHFKNNNIMLFNNKELLMRTNQIGIKYNISFSSQEILPECVLGLDGNHRKLLVVKKGDETIYEWNLIDLDDLTNCTLKKTYRSIKAGELARRKIEEYLETISLQLYFSDAREPVEIPFFIHDSHKEWNVNALDRKARSWQIMLSKMLRQVKEIA